MIPDNTIYYNLLSACSTPHLLIDDQTRIKDLAAQITDWDALIKMAGICRATPLLCDRLIASNATNIPPETLQKLKRSAIINTARSAHLIQSLAGAMHALSEAGIPAITYKGPVLANEAYDNPSLRVFDDLDIIVHKKDLRRAKQVLENLGYREILKLSDNLENSQFRPARAYVLQHQDNTHNIDLTDRLTNNYLSFELPDKNLWGDKQSIEIDGHTVQTMSNECLILYLCAHGAKHLWFRPTWISDVTGLLVKQRSKINWAKTIQLAQSTDGLRMLLIGIKLANKEYGIEIPQPLERHIKVDNNADSICCEIGHIIRRTPGELGCGKYKRALLYLKMRRSIYSRLRSIMLLIIPPSKADRKVIDLPVALYPLYYLIRPFRLISKLITHK